MGIKAAKNKTAVLGVLRTALWETQIQVKHCCREEKELGLAKRKKNHKIVQVAHQEL